jgi:hypothetical protein
VLAWLKFQQEKPQLELWGAGVVACVLGLLVSFGTLDCCMQCFDIQIMIVLGLTCQLSAILLWRVVEFSTA